MYRSLGFLAVLASAAHADTPAFVSLDRTTGTNTSGVHLGVMSFKERSGDVVIYTYLGLRLQLFGEYAISPMFGVVASLPYVWSSGRDSNSIIPDPDERPTDGLGASRIGGYARFRHGDQQHVFIASLILPTEDFVRDTQSVGAEDTGRASMHGTLLPWLEERAIDAGSYWIHGGWSGRYRNGPWRWQADVLFDVPLSQDLYDYAGPAWPIRLHLALGVAHLTPPWALSFELVSSGYPDAPEDRLFTGDPMCRDVPRCKALQVDAVANDKTRMTALTSSVRRTLAERHDVVAWATVGFLQSWFAFGMGYEVQL